MRTLDSRLPKWRPQRTTILWWALALNIELLAVLGYLFIADVTITQPRFLVYPFIWINVGIWAIVRATPAPTAPKYRYIGLLLAGGYFLVLSWAGGLLAPGHLFHGHSHGTGLRIVTTTLPPGWGPAVLYNGPLVQINAIPFKLIGYLSLAYLIYALLLDTAGSVVTGIVGLFSCVSCTWPVLGTVLAGAFGGTSAIAAVAMEQPYGLSTLVFLSAVGLLYWRPFD
ncbi:MAG: hypothetical protein SVG88_04890 [Halobacteriales archaeon]|nr:hypothetical protein [Halobacteriales archaeon]